MSYPNSFEPDETPSYSLSCPDSICLTYSRHFSPKIVSEFVKFKNEADGMLRMRVFDLLLKLNLREISYHLRQDRLSKQTPYCNKATI